MRLHSLQLFVSAVPFSAVFARPVPLTTIDSTYSAAETPNITPNNVLNGTISNEMYLPGLQESLPVSITNNFAGGQLYAYVTGLDPNNAPVLLQPNGQWYYPKPTSNTIPQQITEDLSLTLSGPNQLSNLTIPTYLSSGRIYISQGKLTWFSVLTSDGISLVQPDFNNLADPNAKKNWAYIEFTRLKDGTFVNVSYVDFVGLPLGINLITSTGASSVVSGISPLSMTFICDKLREFARSENQPWDKLCQYSADGSPLRVLSPAKYTAIQDGAFSNYYTSYVQQVYNTFNSAQPLYIAGQNVAAGNFSCTASNNVLSCQGANRNFRTPSAQDILACSGVFSTTKTDNAVVLAAIPRLCAAFNRSTFLLRGGNVQPKLTERDYYDSNPTNRYSQLVHTVQGDGLGYAFPYDDVTPDGARDQSGTLATADAVWLRLTVGG